MALLNLMIGACFIKFSCLLVLLFLSFSSPVLAAAEPRNYKHWVRWVGKIRISNKFEKRGRWKTPAAWPYGFLSSFFQPRSGGLLAFSNWGIGCVFFLLGIPTNVHLFRSIHLFILQLLFFLATSNVSFHCLFSVRVAVLSAVLSDCESQASHWMCGRWR